MNTAAVDFSDMDDLGQAPISDAPIVATEHMLACSRCRGSGNTQWGPCFACKGVGKVSAARLKRVAAFRKGEVTKAANKQSRAAEWREAYPKETEWMGRAGMRFEFAANMLTAVNDYGSLTAGQLAAVQKCMARDAEREAQFAAEKIEREASAPSLGDGGAKILAALNKAAASKLKWPKLRAGVIEFARASDTSKNPGCAYVKRGDTYLGKITPAGAFLASRECDADAMAFVLQVALDPFAAMVLHGKETGTCGCCGRELTDPVSIAAGIGPICANRYF